MNTKVLGHKVLRVTKPGGVSFNCYFSEGGAGSYGDCCEQVSRPQQRWEAQEVRLYLQNKCKGKLVMLISFFAH